MKTRFAVVMVVLMALSGCRSAPTDIVIRLEGPLPLKLVGERMALRIDCTQLDGKSLITTTISPESVFQNARP